MGARNVSPSVGQRSRATGPWGQERRLEFIDFRLQWEGRLNRSDLMTHFGISVPRASSDIASYAELAPGNLAYDRSARIYVATQRFSPIFPTSNAEHFLNDLLALSTSTLGAEGSFIGDFPSVAMAASPARSVPAEVLASVVRAIRAHSYVDVLYQSMSRQEPAWRRISPHGLGHDGFRWHARTFCHSRGAFRDFVFARMLMVKAGEASTVNTEDDSAWFTKMSLVLEPNVKLGVSKRRVVELDYGMTDGKLVLETRQAMLFYVLQRLGLNRDGELRPEAQQIQLKNVTEVRIVLDGLAKSYD